jgi:hypothetical protein
VDFSKLYNLFVDASDYAIAGILFLTQIDNQGNEKPLLGSQLNQNALFPPTMPHSSNDSSQLIQTNPIPPASTEVQYWKLLTLAE